MKCCRTLGLCLLLTATAHGQSDTEPVPNLGDRTPDGFLVKCYWVGTYKCVEKFEGQGVTDLFGQAFSPVCGKSTTTASIIITEEVDDSGQRRGVVRAGTWASKFTGLHYWFKNGKRVGAGPGGSGGGRIPTSGEGAPNVSITSGQNTAGIHLAWTESDALAFESKYLPLKLVMGGPNPLGIGPSGTHRQHLEVDPKEKTERRKAHVMGMMAIEEPVRAGRTVIRQEWGDPGSDWYARWIMTRVCQYGKLKLITPRGDPRTAPRDQGEGQNEFSFDWGSQGKLNILFVASITPVEAINSVAGRVSFSIDPIGASVLEWNHDNPNGRANIDDNQLIARAQFKGLPARNDDFGLKTVQLLLDGQPYEKTKVEIFFHKTAWNHPGGDPRAPNWFHYWQEGGVCGIDANVFYDPDDTDNFGYCNAVTTGSKVFLTQMAAETNSGPNRFSSLDYGSITVTGKGKGIKCVAETLEHERHHIWIYDSFHAGIANASSPDPDKDRIPTTREPSLDALRSDPNNADTYNLAGSIDPDYSRYGDDEVRCRKKELRLTIPYYPKKDWADPGCQSKEKFGPD